MDLIYVAYNSEKWVEPCFSALEKSDYDLKKVKVIVVDNGSTDRTVELLHQVKKNWEGRWGSFEIMEEKKNLGFGKANNLGFARGNSELVCFFNIDTELFPTALSEIERAADCSDEKTAVWELRQFPYEHPKLYDPVTMETSWCSGAAFAVRRTVYQRVGGFDEKIFLYGEDVDFSWRVRSLGYGIQYVPRAMITHYSYEEAGKIKPNQHVYGVIHNLLLRYRFGTVYDMLKGHLQFWLLMGAPEAFPHSKRRLLKEYIKHFWKIPHFLSVKRKKEFNGSGIGFYGWDYAVCREGGYCRNELPEETPLVSVIVRTCGRPEVLRETLISLRNQTYPNIEVVVAEDGENLSEQMIREEFPDLKLVYFSTGQKVGRSRAGNLAMEKSSGKYLNFLDDDDLFFADHVETLAARILKGKERAAYAFGFETPIQVISRKPYQYKVKQYHGAHKQEFDKVVLCHHNYIPIQTILFERTLFEEYGGMDETLDALEDWDLWVRYSLHTDFACVKKTTSLYRVPYDKRENARRQKALDEALAAVREKHKNYVQRVSVYDIAVMYEELLLWPR